MKGFGTIEELGIDVFKQRILPKLYADCLLFQDRKKISTEIYQDIDVILPIFEKLELTNIITVLELFKEDQSIDILDVFPSNPTKLFRGLVNKYEVELADRYFLGMERHMQAIAAAFKFVQSELPAYEIWYLHGRLARILASIELLDQTTQDARATCLCFILAGIDSSEKFADLYCSPFNGDFE